MKLIDHYEFRIFFSFQFILSFTYSIIQVTYGRFSIFYHLISNEEKGDNPKFFLNEKKNKQKIKHDDQNGILKIYIFHFD